MPHNSLATLLQSIQYVYFLYYKINLYEITFISISYPPVRQFRSVCTCLAFYCWHGDDRIEVNTLPDKPEQNDLVGAFFSF